MAIIQSTDKSMSPHQTMCKLLGKLINTGIPEEQQREHLNSFSKLTEGMNPETIGINFNLKTELVNEKDMQYLLIYIPKDELPIWFDDQVHTDYVKFALAVYETKPIKQ